MNFIKVIKGIILYNSIVIGKYNYYWIVMYVSLDFNKMVLEFDCMMYNCFFKWVRRGKSNINGYINIGKYVGEDKGIKLYLKFKMMRYFMKCFILLIFYVLYKNLVMKK